MVVWFPWTESCRPAGFLDLRVPGVLAYGSVWVEPPRHHTPGEEGRQWKRPQAGAVFGESS